MKKISILSLLLIANWSVLANTAQLANIATQILQKLYYTKGDYSYTLPSIEVSTDTKSVAAYKPFTNKIVIEEKAWAICQTFGENAWSALAFIISHELAHAAEKEHETNYLAYDHVVDGDKKKEYDADVFGLFNAYLANYRSIEILPDLIEKIYIEYSFLEKEFANYPSLEERKDIAITVKNSVAELINIYEGANYLVAYGKYELATASYEYILKSYQGREVYNNLAINAALHAINFTDKDVDVMLYPLELDWNTRLKKNRPPRGYKDLDPMEQQYRQQYLIKAKKYLNNSLQLDNNYYIAHLNMMCVLSLLGQQQEAIDYYYQKQLNDKDKWTNATAISFDATRSALAVAHSKKENSNQSIITARKIWEELKQHPSPTIAYPANYNLKMLSQTKCEPLREFNAQPTIEVEELIDNVRLHRFNPTTSITLSKTEKIGLGMQKTAHSVIYKYTTPKASFILQRVVNFPQQGQKLSQLKGEALANVVVLSQGHFEIFKPEKAMLFYDEKGQLKEWAKF